MSRTRKFREGRRRKTLNRRRRAMKGGGKLDRLPVGPGSRNEAGNPAEEYFEMPTGAGAASRMRVGTSEALDYGRRDYQTRLGHILVKKPEDMTDKNLAELIVKTVGKLPRNTQRGYANSPLLYKSRQEQYADKFGIVSSTLNEVPALPEIPPTKHVMDEIKMDFTNNWDFKYICGHGVLAPDKPQIIVPERTYIRFNSPAGCNAVASSAIAGMLPPMISFPEIFMQAQVTKAQEKEAFIKKFTQHYFENTGPLESFRSLAERQAVLSSPYPSEFCKLRRTTDETLMEQSTEAACLSDIQKKRTIYMPGETMQEMNISFKNNPNQILLLGVYNLPVDYKFYQAITTEALLSNDRPLTAAQQLGLDIKYFKNDSFMTSEGEIRNPNLNKSIIGGKVLLSRVLAELPPVPEGKVRFLFINSCRGIPFVKNDDGLRRNVMQTWNAVRGAGGAGAGAGAAAPKLIDPEMRRNLAILQRSASVGNNSSFEKMRQVAELAETLKWLKAHPVDDGSAEYRRQKAIENQAFERTQHPPFDNTYSLARSLVEE